LIAAKPEAALEKAKAMVPRLGQSKVPRQLQGMMVQFIETVIVHQFPSWSRAEIEKMLQVTDVRQTRVFQEALEEGRQEGREQGIETVARRLIELGRPVTEIARATGLTAAQVRKLAKKRKK
jgi:predicted transposase/invertase (TIGR01784 family)